MLTLARVAAAMASRISLTSNDPSPRLSTFTPFTDVPAGPALSQML